MRLPIGKRKIGVADHHGSRRLTRSFQRHDERVGRRVLDAVAVEAVGIVFVRVKERFRFHRALRKCCAAVGLIPKILPDFPRHVMQILMIAKHCCSVKLRQQHEIALNGTRPDIAGDYARPVPKNHRHFVRVFRRQRIARPPPPPQNPRCRRNPPPD